MSVSLTKKVNLRKYFIYYSADVITPDGSDSDVYGEACEPGHGMTRENGWLDPDWSRDTVYESHRDVRADRYEAAWDGDPRKWLAERLATRLEYVDLDSATWRSVYSSEGYTDPYTGVTVTVAAHPEGFEQWEIDSALDMIRRERISLRNL